MRGVRILPLLLPPPVLLLPLPALPPLARPLLPPLLLPISLRFGLVAVVIVDLDLIVLCDLERSRVMSYLCIYGRFQLRAHLLYLFLG